MSHNQNYEATQVEYSSVSFRRSQSASSSKQRRPSHGRSKSKSPQSINGIHRRRKRKISW